MITDQDYESAIFNCHKGDRCPLVYAAMVKRELAHELPEVYRLKFLEWLEICGKWLTPEVVAAIEPMCERGDELMSECRKLGKFKCIDAVTQPDIFRTFVALNPSLLTAIKMHKDEYRFEGRAS